MVTLDDIRREVISGIKSYLQIPIIRANQTAQPPDFPYGTYTITTLMKANNGTYGEFVENIDGVNKKVYRKEFQQIWSFTILSDDDIQSKALAIKLYDYLDKVGSVELATKGIVIQRIGNITNRDNLLTIEYQYRNGFDVTFAFMNEIVAENAEDIDTYNFTYNAQV